MATRTHAQTIGADYIGYPAKLLKRYFKQDVHFEVDVRRPSFYESLNAPQCDAKTHWRMLKTVPPSKRQMDLKTLTELSDSHASTDKTWTETMRTMEMVRAKLKMPVTPIVHENVNRYVSFLGRLVCKKDPVIDFMTSNGLGMGHNVYMGVRGVFGCMAWANKSRQNWKGPLSWGTNVFTHMYEILRPHMIGSADRMAQILRQTDRLAPVLNNCVGALHDVKRLRILQACINDGRHRKRCHARMKAMQGHPLLKKFKAMQRGIGKVSLDNDEEIDEMAKRIDKRSVHDFVHTVRTSSVQYTFHLDNAIMQDELSHPELAMLNEVVPRAVSTAWSLHCNAIITTLFEDVTVVITARHFVFFFDGDRVCILKTSGLDEFEELLAEQVSVALCLLVESGQNASSAYLKAQGKFFCDMMRQPYWKTHLIGSLFRDAEGTAAMLPMSEITPHGLLTGRDFQTQHPVVWNYVRTLCDIDRRISPLAAVRTFRNIPTTRHSHTSILGSAVYVYNLALPQMNDWEAFTELQLKRGFLDMFHRFKGHYPPTFKRLIHSKGIEHVAIANMRDDVFSEWEVCKIFDFDFFAYDKHDVSHVAGTSANWESPEWIENRTLAMRREVLAIDEKFHALLMQFIDMLRSSPEPGRRLPVVITAKPEHKLQNRTIPGEGGLNRKASSLIEKNTMPYVKTAPSNMMGLSPSAQKQKIRRLMNLAKAHAGPVAFLQTDFVKFGHTMDIRLQQLLYRMFGAFCGETWMENFISHLIGQRCFINHGHAVSSFTNVHGRDAQGQRNFMWQLLLMVLEPFIESEVRHELDEWLAPVRIESVSYSDDKAYLLRWKPAKGNYRPPSHIVLAAKAKAAFKRAFHKVALFINEDKTKYSISGMVFLGTPYGLDGQINIIAKGGQSLIKDPVGLAPSVQQLAATVKGNASTLLSRECPVEDAWSLMALSFGIKMCMSVRAKELPDAELVSFFSLAPTSRGGLGLPVDLMLTIANSHITDVWMLNLLYERAIIDHLPSYKTYFSGLVWSKENDVQSVTNPNIFRNLARHSTGSPVNYLHTVLVKELVKKGHYKTYEQAVRARKLALKLIAAAQPVLPYTLKKSMYDYDIVELYRQDLAKIACSATGRYLLSPYARSQVQIKSRQSFGLWMENAQKLVSHAPGVSWDTSWTDIFVHLRVPQVHVCTAIYPLLGCALTDDPYSARRHAITVKVQERAALEPYTHLGQNVREPSVLPRDALVVTRARSFLSTAAKVFYTLTHSIGVNPILADIFRAQWGGFDFGSLIVGGAMSGSDPFAVFNILREVSNIEAAGLHRTFGQYTPLVNDANEYINDMNKQRVIEGLGMYHVNSHLLAQLSLAMIRKHGVHESTRSRYVLLTSALVYQTAYDSFVRTRRDEPIAFNHSLKPPVFNVKALNDLLTAYPDMSNMWDQDRELIFRQINREKGKSSKRFEQTLSTHINRMIADAGAYSAQDLSGLDVAGAGPIGAVFGSYYAADVVRLRDLHPPAAHAPVVNHDTLFERTSQMSNWRRRSRVAPIVNLQLKTIETEKRLRNQHEPNVINNAGVDVADPHIDVDFESLRTIIEAVPTLQMMNKRQLSRFLLDRIVDGATEYFSDHRQLSLAMLLSSYFDILQGHDTNVDAVIGRHGFALPVNLATYYATVVQSFKATEAFLVMLRRLSKVNRLSKYTTVRDALIAFSAERAGYWWHWIVKRMNHITEREFYRSFEAGDIVGLSRFYSRFGTRYLKQAMDLHVAMMAHVRNARIQLSNPHWCVVRTEDAITHRYSGQYHVLLLLHHAYKRVAKKLQTWSMENVSVAYERIIDVVLECIRMLPCILAAREHETWNHFWRRSRLARDESFSTRKIWKKLKFWGAQDRNVRVIFDVYRIMYNHAARRITPLIRDALHVWRRERHASTDRYSDFINNLSGDSFAYCTEYLLDEPVLDPTKANLTALHHMLDLKPGVVQHINLITDHGAVGVGTHLSGNRRANVMRDRFEALHMRKFPRADVVLTRDEKDLAAMTDAQLGARANAIVEAHKNEEKLDMPEEVERFESVKAALTLSRQFAREAMAERQFEEAFLAQPDMDTYSHAPGVQRRLKNMLVAEKRRKTTRRWKRSDFAPSILDRHKARMKRKRMVRSRTPPPALNRVYPRVSAEVIVTLPHHTEPVSSWIAARDELGTKRGTTNRITYNCYASTINKVIRLHRRTRVLGDVSEHVRRVVDMSFITYVCRATPSPELPDVPLPDDAHILASAYEDESLVILESVENVDDGEEEKEEPRLAINVNAARLAPDMRVSLGATKPATRSKFKADTREVMPDALQDTQENYDDYVRRSNLAHREREKSIVNTDTQTLMRQFQVQLLENQARLRDDSDSSTMPIPVRAMAPHSQSDANTSDGHSSTSTNLTMPIPVPITIAPAVTVPATIIENDDDDDDSSSWPDEEEPLAYYGA